MNKYKLFDRLHEGVQVIDKNMCYLYVNQSVADQSKQSIDDLLGNAMIDVFPSLRDSEVVRCIEQCMVTQEPHEMLNEFLHNDGSKEWFSLRMEPVNDGVIIFSINVTKQKLLEERVAELAEMEFRVEERTQELMQELHNEMALNNCKAKFVSMASHQLRTPLTSIILSTDIVETYGNDLLKKEKIVRQFDRIKSSARHMVAVLNDFLTFDEVGSSRSRYVPIPTNLQAFVKDIKELLFPLLKSGQQIRTAIDYPSDKANIDPHIIKGLLLNLLSNAIKYSPEDTTIHLTIEEKEEVIGITVRDHGIGIPNKDQAKLFDTFFRASNVQDIQGNGLGLNIVKQYVELANGSISFESKEGEGTKFVVEIPTLISEYA